MSDVKTGIYKITNLDNGKMYVGQALNIERRWGEHKSSLRSNKHSNGYLQHAWNVHGEDRFDFSIIEECEIDELSDLEMYWIDKLRSFRGFSDSNGYNLTTGGEGNRIFTEEVVKPACDLFNRGKTVLQIANILNIEPKKARRHLKFGNHLNLCNYDPEEASRLAHQQPVVCLTTGKIFESCKEAELFYNVHGVASCCVGTYKYAGRDEDGACLVWRHLDDYNKMTSEEVEQCVDEVNRQVHDMDIVCMNNNLVFETAPEAAKCMGIKSSSVIHNNCRNKQKYAGKNPQTGEHYVWMYVKDYINLTEEEREDRIKKGQLNNISDIYKKKVICLNNNIIFDGSDLAESYALNTNKDKIKNCCRGGTRSAGIDPIDGSPLTWMYYDDYQNATQEEIDAKLENRYDKGTRLGENGKLICLNNLYVFRNPQEASDWCGLKNPSSIRYNLKKNMSFTGKHPETGERLKWALYKDYVEQYGTDNLVDYKMIKKKTLEKEDTNGLF